MKVFLFLALIVSSYSYAQSGHNHEGETQKKGDQHGDMHGGDHHGMGGMGGMMMHGGHHKLDKATLKHFFEPLPASIIDEKKHAALIALGKKLYLDPSFQSMTRFLAIPVIN